MTSLPVPTWRLLYSGKPGEKIKLLPTGGAVVVHPNNSPKVVRIDGRVEKLKDIA